MTENGFSCHPCRPYRTYMFRRIEFESPARLRMRIFERNERRDQAGVSE
jgi:hypothetical protein